LNGSLFGFQKDSSQRLEKLIQLLSKEKFKEKLKVSVGSLRGNAREKKHLKEKGQPRHMTQIEALGSDKGLTR
jgi:hypothetical protein